MKYSYKYFVILLSLICSMSLFSQVSLVRSNCYGGSLDEYAEGIIHTSDDCLVMVGHSASMDDDISFNHGNFDIWVTKLTIDGEIIWERACGGALSDLGRSVIECADSSYLVVGWSDSYDGDITEAHGRYDYWIFKISSDGEILWEKTYGGSNVDCANSAVELEDGGFVIAGSSQSSDDDISSNIGYKDFWIVRLDSIGEIVWERSYGSEGNDEANVIKRTTDGNLVIAGYASNNDHDVSGVHGRSSDFWLIKITPDGELLWQKCLGGTQNDIAYDLEITDDNGFIICGYSKSSDGDISEHLGSTTYKDYWIVKTDSLGEIEWEKSLGGRFDDECLNMLKTSEGDFVFVGQTESYDHYLETNYGASDIWIVCLDLLGEIQWNKHYGGTNTDIIYDLCEISSEFYAIAGYTSSNDFDIYGNHGIADYWMIQLTMLNNTLNLYPGWNLIAYPYESPMAVSDLDSIIVLPGYTYNSATRTNDPVSELVESQGYWLLSMEESSIMLPDESESIVNLELVPGWNLIGGPNLYVPVSDFGFLTEIITPIYEYDPITRNNSPSDIIEPFKGYWILATDSIVVNIGEY